MALTNETRYYKEQGDIDMIGNFDFTQFITFESSLDCGNIDHLIKELFEGLGFEVVAYEDIDAVKKEYYNSHWKQYTFELKKDDFLSPFMDWKNEDTVPEDIEKFIEKINLLLQYEVSELGIIICYFAEKGTTTDEVIATTQDKIIHYLFKMSIHSFKCPDNLIVNIC